MTQNSDSPKTSDVDASRSADCYLAFRVGEWYSQALRHLDRAAFDSRELGRHLLTLTCRAIGLDDVEAETIEQVREAAISVCVSCSGIGSGGPQMVEEVRRAMVSEIAR